MLMRLGAVVAPVTCRIASDSAKRWLTGILGLWEDGVSVTCRGAGRRQE